MYRAVEISSASRRGRANVIASSLLVPLMLAVFGGCLRQKQASDQPTVDSRQKQQEKPAAKGNSPVRVHSSERAVGERVTPSHRNPGEAPTRVPLPTELKGIPSPQAICGHAVAFAGWRASAGENGQRLLFVDPGDNEIEAGSHTHRWDADPAESTVLFGERRPIVVLSPADPFTIVGAVVLSPKGAAAAQDPVDMPVTRMPDLSQVPDGNWPGLCGPTSMADILYAIAYRRPRLLVGFDRGPSPKADSDAARLIVGEDGKLAADSLASRMSLRRDGVGVTSIGMRDGMAEWLEDHDADGWSVTLDWIDDHSKEPDEQEKFFQRLASVSRKGGGAVLCLWPGAEFADSSTEESASGVGVAVGPPSSDRSARPSLPDDGVAPSASRGDDGEASHADRLRGFEGQKADPRATAAALEQARQSMERAEQAFLKGNTTAANDYVAGAITVLRTHASGNHECRAALVRAEALADQIEASMPQQSRTSNNPTRFQ